MSTEYLAQAFADTRRVVTNVTPDQLGLPTPCQSWKVRDLLNHMVGAPQWAAAAVSAGDAPLFEDFDFPEIGDGDFVAEFDKGVAAAVAAFGASGAEEKMVTLPFGTMPGSALMGLATTDTFTHGWDLAKSTGQSTDIDPELAEQLLAGSKMAIQDAFRGEDTKMPFGPEQTAPGGASAADKLAAFLGRKV